MRSIIKKSKLFEAVIGSQNYSAEKEYRFLTYVLFFEYKGEMLLMNTLTRELIILSLESFNDIKNGRKNDLYIKLVNNWFLVPKSYDDYNFKSQCISLINSFNTQKGLNKYVIMPTMDCNARCFYCFEHGSRRYPMSNETAHDVSKFILKNSLNQKILIQWFGGEPLYNINAIDIISNDLIENNQPFKSIMISNGYLFDNEIILKAKKIWNLQMVQITLDGTEEIYNKTKAYIYKTDKSPFYIVLNNIKLLLEAGIKVNIRLNMDRHNKQDLFSLVDILNSNFDKYKDLLFVYAWLLYDNRGKIKNIRSDSERIILTNDLIELEDYIYSLNLGSKRTPSKKISTVSCLGDNPYATVILPDGHLGKCDHHSDDEFYGSIYSDEIDTNVINSWKIKREPVELCFTCPLLPQCNHLKKCPDDGAYDCDISLQKQRLSSLKRQMKNAYDKYFLSTKE